MFVHNVLDEYGLDPYEFRIYAHAVRRTGGKLNGEYFASLTKTAEICQMSIRKAQYALKFLCEAGFLTQEKRKGRTDVYRMTHSRDWVKPEKLEEIREKVTGVKKKNLKIKVNQRNLKRQQLKQKLKKKTKINQMLRMMSGCNSL